MSIITQEQQSRGDCPIITGEAVDSGLSPVNVIRNYKQEFYDLYDELLTVAMSAGCKHLIPDNATSRIIALRLADEIECSDEIADWQGVTAMMIDIQHKAEKDDGDCCEVDHRAAYLAHRASEITRKMREEARNGMS